LVPIIAALAQKYICKPSTFPILVSTLLVLQFILDRNFLLENFIMFKNPRISLFQKNLEGFYSLSGYINIYLLAAFIGKDLFQMQAPAQYHSFKSRLFWTNLACLIISVLLWRIGVQPSRRCANLAYVLWTCAICGWQLFIVFAYEWLLGSRMAKMRTLDSIAKHQLAIFLVANLLTGLINLKFKPLLLNWGGCLTTMITYNNLLLQFNKLLK
jgi:glucosaminylphosphatidylinositol acyltransferase